MPILTYDFQDVIAFGAEHSTLGPIVQRAAARMGVALSPDPLPEEGLFTRSDHYNFVREGVPSVFLMTGFAGPGQEQFTSFLRNQYHGVDDDLNQTIDWAAALARLGASHLDEEIVLATLGVVLKYREDQARVRAHGVADVVRAAVTRSA